MKSESDKSEVIRIINNIIKMDQVKVSNILLDKLEDKLTKSEIYNITSNFDVGKFNNIALIWIYGALFDFYDLKDISTYFTDIELKRAETYYIERKNISFPLTFKNVIKVTDNEEYKFFISIQELKLLMSLGILRLVEGMQRESITSMYNNKIVSHVAYNDSKAREIGKAIVSGEYHPKDDISIHLISDGEEDYIFDGENLVIKSGNLALLDGQHREAGIEYALLEDMDINMSQSIYFTVGSVEMAQSIIAQHEKQTPIKKELVESYTNSDGKFIFTRFSTNPDISKYYKFADNYETVKKGFAMATSGDMIRTINKYYGKKMKLKERNDVSKWLIEFFTELVYIYEDDLLDFKNVRKIKWNMKGYAFSLYIYISKYLYKREDWKEVLFDILNKIDFTNEPEGSKYNVRLRNAIKIVQNITDGGE